MDSGFPSAIGYSSQSGIPLHIGLLRNHWVGRTFIQPDQNSRARKVREKLTPISQIIEGKRVILVDDSIVRGTTSKEIISILKKAGAREVHFRLASPMLVNTCLWGVDIPTKEELIAHKCETEQKIAEFLGAESVKYLSFKGLQEIFGEKDWCYNCFTRNKKESGC
jgi:amidophosphoribosyltransferase